MVLIDSIDITGLRVAHFKQLLFYLEYAESHYGYYGNKSHFDKRHEDLKQWLNKQIAILDKSKIKVKEIKK